MKNLKTIKSNIFIILCVLTALFSSCNQDYSHEESSYYLVSFTAKQSETTTNAITLTWRDTKKADKYYIYYNTTNDSSSATKYTYYGYVSAEYDSSFKTTGYFTGSKDIPFSESGTYYFWLKAVDGNSNQSNFSECAYCTFISE